MATIESLFRQLSQQLKAQLEKDGAGSSVAPSNEKPFKDDEIIFYRKDGRLYKKDASGNEVYADNRREHYNNTTNNCYIISVSGPQQRECSNIMNECVKGDKEKCKEILNNTNFWNAVSKTAIRNDIQGVLNFVKSIGLRTIEKSYNGRKYVAFETKESWISHVDADLGLGDNGYKSIGNNLKINAFIETVIDVTNKDPSILNYDIKDAKEYFGGDGPNDSALSSGFFGQFLNPKAAYNKVSPTSQLNYLIVRPRDMWWNSVRPMVYTLQTGNHRAVMVGGGNSVQQRIRNINQIYELPNCLKRAKNLISQFEQALASQGKHIDPQSKQDMDNVLSVLEGAQNRYIKYLALLMATNQIISVDGDANPNAQISTADMEKMVHKFDNSTAKLNTAQDQVIALLQQLIARVPVFGMGW